MWPEAALQAHSNLAARLIMTSEFTGNPTSCLASCDIHSVGNSIKQHVFLFSFVFSELRRTSQIECSSCVGSLVRRRKRRKEEVVQAERVFYLKSWCLRGELLWDQDTKLKRYHTMLEMVFMFTFVSGDLGAKRHLHPEPLKPRPQNSEWETGRERKRGR